VSDSALPYPFSSVTALRFRECRSKKVVNSKGRKKAYYCCQFW
jgi:hypothetical protein